MKDWAFYLAMAFAFVFVIIGFVFLIMGDIDKAFLWFIIAVACVAYISTDNYIKEE